MCAPQRKYVAGLSVGGVTLPDTAASVTMLLKHSSHLSRAMLNDIKPKEKTLGDEYHNTSFSHRHSSSLLLLQNGAAVVQETITRIQNQEVGMEAHLRNKTQFGLRGHPLPHGWIAVAPCSLQYWCWSQSPLQTLVSKPQPQSGTQSLGVARTQAQNGIWGQGA